MEKTLDDILGDFPPKVRQASIRRGGSFSLWLPDDFKARYDRLQAASGRTFNQKVRELVMALIERAEEKLG